MPQSSTSICNYGGACSGEVSAFLGPEGPQSYQGPSFLASFSRSEDSISIEEEQIDQELLEEEGLIPDQLIFKGLFRHHLFKALLFKAKSLTRLVMNYIRPDNSIGKQDHTKLLFSESMTEAEAIPAPQLFMDMIQHQWASPGAYPKPISFGKLFKNVDLTELLQTPEVDKLVMALASLSDTLMEAEDVLKPDERKLKLVLHKAH